MGEDQLQRLFKIGPSESLLFQLEMEKVRVPSGNVSGTNFPLQNVPQMFRQMWGTLVPSESVWVSKSVSWMFLTLINLPCQAQKCLRWAVVATKDKKVQPHFVLEDFFISQGSKLLAFIWHSPSPSTFFKFGFRLFASPLERKFVPDFSLNLLKMFCLLWIY